MCICHVLSNKGQWLDITLMYGWIKVPPWQTEFKFTCWEVHHFLIKNIKCVNRHYISNLHNNPSLADFRDIEIHSFCSNSYTATSGFQLLHKVHFIEFWLIFSKSVRIEKKVPYGPAISRHPTIEPSFNLFSNIFCVNLSKQLLLS